MTKSELQKIKFHYEERIESESIVLAAIKRFKKKSIAKVKA